MLKKSSNPATKPAIRNSRFSYTTDCLHDFISRTALANVLHEYLRNVPKNPVIAVIRRKQNQHRKNHGNFIDKQREVA